MWKALENIYEKSRNRINHSDKYYSTLFVNGLKTKRGRVKHRTAESALEYAVKFNRRCKKYV